MLVFSLSLTVLPLCSFTVLRDTLLLIESQSEMLQAHNEHFFSSILSAIDSLGQPSQASPVQQSTKERSLVVQEST